MFFTSFPYHKNQSSHPDPLGYAPLSKPTFLLKLPMLLHDIQLMLSILLGHVSLLGKDRDQSSGHIIRHSVGVTIKREGGKGKLNNHSV